MTAKHNEGTVELTIPRVTAEDRPVFLGVNGECVRIRPGETVHVPRRFAEVWENAQAQEAAARAFCRRADRASKTALAAL